MSFCAVNRRGDITTRSIVTQQQILIKQKVTQKESKQDKIAGSQLHELHSVSDRCDHIPYESQQAKEEQMHSELADCICNTCKRGSVPQKLPEKENHYSKVK